VYNVLNTVLLVGRAFALSVIIARALGPSLQGLYSFLITAVVVLVQLVTLGFPNTIIRFVSQRMALNDREGASAILSYVIRRELLLATIATVLVFATAMPLSVHLAEGIPFWLLCLAALAIMPDSLMVISEATFEGLLAYRTLCRINLLLVPASVTVAGVLLMLGGKVPELLILKVVVSSCRVILYYRVLRGHIGQRGCSLEDGLKKQVTSYARSLSSIFLFDAVVWQRSEVFFLAYFRSRAEVAFYDIAYMVVGVAMRILPEKLADILFPVLSGLEGTGEEEKAMALYQRSTRLLFAIAISIAVGVFVYAPTLISLVYGNEYLPTTTAIRIFCVASPIIIIARATAYVLYSAGWQHFNVRLAGIAAGVNLALDAVLIPRGGLIGAALANSITQVFSVIVLVTYVLNRKKTALPWSALLRTLGAAVVQMAVLVTVQLWLTGWVLLVVGAVFSVGVYLVMLCLLGVLTHEEQRQLTDMLLLKRWILRE
jgi:O-antigen/teichoic acid export membrane protein